MDVLKLGRVKECFERGKVNSRCFNWFPDRVSILNTIIISGTFCRITRVEIYHSTEFLKS